MPATTSTSDPRPHAAHLNSAAAASAALSAAASRRSSAAADAAIRTALPFAAAPTAGACGLDAASGPATCEGGCCAATGGAAAGCCLRYSMQGSGHIQELEATNCDQMTHLADRVAQSRPRSWRPKCMSRNSTIDCLPGRQSAFSWSGEPCKLLTA